MDYYLLRKVRTCARVRVGVQVTSCRTACECAPNTSGRAGDPWPGRPGQELMSEMIARTHTIRSVEIPV